MLVQACLCAGKTFLRRFPLLGSGVQHVEACLSAREDRESSFVHCGSPVWLMQACLCEVKA